MSVLCATRISRFVFLVPLVLFLTVSGDVEAQTKVGNIYPIELNDAVDYTGSPDGSLRLAWEHTLTYPGATYMAAHFRNFQLAPGDYLEVSDADGRQSYRLDGRGKLDAGTFWGQHVKGSTLTLRLWVRNPSGAQGFQIDEFAAGFEDIGSVETQAICGSDDKENAVCYESSHPVEYDKARAVVRLLINGGGLCTGWMVSPDDLMVTNEHCITTNSDALNTDYEFMAEAPNCSDFNCQLCHDGVVFSGGTLIQDNAGLDYALVQITSGNPAATYGYLEIDDRAAIVGEEIYIPQHPGGRAKELGIFSSDGSDTGGICRVFSTTRPPCSGSGYNDVGYYCDTEGGSSGSPVLARDSHKVIALHHCANCPNRGVPINLVYAEIEQFLCADRPSRLVAAATVTGDNEVLLEWNDADVVGVIEYVVERSRTQGGPYEIIATLPDTSPGVAGGAGMSFLDTDVSGGATYYYVVSGSDGGSCVSDPSPEVSALATGSCTLEPIFGGVGSVSNAAEIACTLNLSWSLAIDECGGPVVYNVYRGLGGSFIPSPSNRIATHWAGSSFTDFDQLISGGIYAYVVRAVDLANGVEDDNLNLLAGSPTGPGGGACTTVSVCEDNPFVDVEPEASTECVNSGFQLSAVTTGGSGDFAYQWLRDGVPVPGATGASYTPVLTGPHAYNVQVTAATCVDAIFDGSDSQITMVDAPFFDGVELVDNAHSETCGVDLSWNAATGVCAGPIRYFVYRDTDSPVQLTAENLVAAGISGTSFTDSADLVTGETFHYRVQAQDASTGGFDGNVVEKSAFADGPGSGPNAVLNYDFEDASDISDWTVTTGPGLHTCGEWAQSTDSARRPSGGSGNFAIADNQCNPLFSRTSTTMTSPAVPVTLANMTSVTLEFDMWYDDDGAESGSVEVFNGSSWQTVWQDAGSDVNASQVMDVTAEAAGNNAFQVRFDYQDATQDRWFSVDDVQVIAHVEVACSTADAQPPSVPDGDNGTQPIRAERLDTNGDALQVNWDASTCGSSSYNLLFGSLSDVSSMGIGGSACALGGSGSYGWNAVPAGDLFFLVVGSDGNGTEGSWGVDGGGGERGGFAASGQCGATTKSSTDSCR
ncbi:MAG: serine protease [Acidobacteriota bacterium]|nr:serine protease [Acidobacteriota bacterium]